MKTAVTFLFLVAGVALLLWIARPYWDEVNILRAEKAQLSDQLARLHDLETLRDELINTYNSIPKDKLERLNAMLPPQAEVGNLLVTLERLAAERGIKLRNINFTLERDRSQTAASTELTSQELKASPLKKVSYTFSISGSYESFRTYLAALEKTLRLVDVGEISFGSAGLANVYDINIRAKSYYQK